MWELDNSAAYKLDLGLWVLLSDMKTFSLLCRGSMWYDLHIALAWALDQVLYRGSLYRN